MQAVRLFVGNLDLVDVRELPLVGHVQLHDTLHFVIICGCVKKQSQLIAARAD